MAASDHNGQSGPPPETTGLLALSSDAWGRLLVHVRAALHELEEVQLTPELRRMRATPASRLVSGRLQARLAALIAAGGPLWQRLRARLEDAAPLPGDLEWLLTGEPPPSAQPPSPPTLPAPDREEAARRKQRSKALKDERDRALRRADGAESRTHAVETKLAALSRELDAERDRVTDLEAELEDAGRERDQAVERERRRNEAEMRGLREELRQLRRTLQELQAARREAATMSGSAAAASAGPTVKPPTADRVQPGRPTFLPPNVHPVTVEAADLLLGRGRQILVDGYNVSKQHRSHLSLADQRAWLTQLLAGFAARRGVRCEVVFDGQAPPGGQSSSRLRGVTVRFSSAGTTADEDLEFAVAALPPDEPVVVVTDDRELRRLVGRYHVDVVGTQAFLSVAL